MSKKHGLFLLGSIEAVLLFITIKGLFFDGLFSWHIRQKETLLLWVELLFIFVLLVSIFVFVMEPIQRFVAAGVTIAIFSWLHMVFLPIILAILYIAYICMLGKIFRIYIFKMKTSVNLITELLLGTAALLCIYCLMSAVGIGKINVLKGFLIITSIPLTVYVYLLCRTGKERISHQIRSVFTWSLPQSLMIGGILIFILLQAGRMNQAVDYDSYWYGVRSQYMLENGGGIYENLGTVSLVYTYSKGLEVLTLPLSNLDSYSFLTAFNVIMAVFVLYIAYRIVTIFVSGSYGLLAVLLLSSIPGIMNMTVTTKTDIFTLVFQLMILLFMMYYLYERKVVYLILSISALLLSWSLKPTAMIFSTAIFGMSGIFLLVKKKLRLKAEIRHWAAVFLSLFALLGIWARTFLLVGVPVTSIFSSVFTKIGFKIKYPFGGMGITNHSPNLWSKEGLIFLGQRLYGIFINPSDARMDHMVIAWGTILVLYCIFVILCTHFWGKSLSDGSRELKQYLYVVFIPFAVVNFVSMMILYRPDGNYFMLFYTMVILLGVIGVYYIRLPYLRKGMVLLFIPLIIFNFAFSSISNWAWAIGLSPVKVVHKGYYDHKRQAKEEMIQSGNSQIWSILESNPRTRVIGIGYHPNVLLFPCNIQSYYDIWTWGNEGLIESSKTLEEYMEYAKTDYIYVQRDFINHSSMYSKMMKDLFMDGVLTDLLYENGNLLAKVDLSGPGVGDGIKNYEEFLELYDFYVEEP